MSDGDIIKADVDDVAHAGHDEGRLDSVVFDELPSPFDAMLDRRGVGGLFAGRRQADPWAVRRLGHQGGQCSGLGGIVECG